MKSQMNPSVPEFEKLFKTLSKQEKKNFKPFLKILAHSLQFVDKLSSVNNKYEALKEEMASEQRDKEMQKVHLMEKQIIKLQNSCKDFIMSEESFKGQLEYMQQKNQDLEKELKITKKNYQLLEKESKAQENSDVIKQERNQLKNRLSEALKDLQNKENTLEEMALNINELKETEMKYFDCLEDKKNLKKVIEEKEKDLELNQTSLNNLQNALTEQQESYEWTINDVEKEKNELEDTIKRLEDSIQTIQDEVKTKVIDTSTVDKLEKQNQQLTTDLDQLVVQKQELAKELETVKDKLKTQELSKGDMIDRRVINQFLIQYLNHQSSEMVKKQMLESMASILDFSVEDKQTLGIL